jgi:hypothetical protein
VSNLNGRKVKVARVHAIVHVPGVGQLGPAIDENSAKFLGGLSLFKEEDGMLVKGKTFELFIPNGNIISMLLEPEAK